MVLIFAKAATGGVPLKKSVLKNLQYSQESLFKLQLYLIRDFGTWGFPVNFVNLDGCFYFTTTAVYFSVIYRAGNFQVGKSH